MRASQRAWLAAIHSLYAVSTIARVELEFMCDPFSCRFHRRSSLFAERAALAAA